MRPAPTHSIRVRWLRRLVRRESLEQAGGERTGGRIVAKEFVAVGCSPGVTSLGPGETRKGRLEEGGHCTLCCTATIKGSLHGRAAGFAEHPYATSGGAPRRGRGAPKQSHLVPPKRK